LSIFRASTEIYFGADRYSDLRSRIGNLYPKVSVCIDSALVESEAVREIVDFFKSFSKVTEFHITVKGEPTYENLRQTYASFQGSNEPDLIVGIGGGSTLDLVKGIALLCTHSEAASNPISLRGMNQVRTPGIPLLLVPSTCGTGSEVTWTASLIDEEEGVKLGINGDHVFAKYALLEPRLVVGAPKSVIISSALDALVHASEAISSKMTSEFASSLARSSIKRIFDNFESLVIDDEPGVRLASAESMLIASAEAGLAMLNSSGGLASALSYPLGARLRVPHGIAGGVPLVLVESLYENLGYNSMHGFLVEGQSYSSQLQKLYEVVGAPSSLSDWGLTDYGLQRLVDATFEEKKGSIGLCPVQISKSQALNILEAIA